jgi:azurin
MKRKLLLLALLIGVVSLSISCGGAKEVSVTLSTLGNEMKFDQEVLEIPAGSKVTLTFVNKATMEAMKHNVVVLKPKTNVKQFASEALAHGPSYVPANSNAIVAHTDMSNPGETVSVTFTMPEKKGYYPYVCTFPGHASSMKGTIRAK